MKLSQNVQKVGRQPPDIYSVLGGKKTNSLFFCFTNPMFQGKENCTQWSVVGRKGDKIAFEILLRFPIPWGSVPNPEEGNTEHPHNVWLHS